MDIVYTFSHYTLAFIVVLSVLVFIHEYGHYMVAKLSGVQIEVFSIGFGKEIYGWTDKSGTRWKISLLPFGGYVRMLGDGSEASTPDKKKLASLSEEEKQKAFATKPLWIKALVVVAGPAANFLFAIFILTGFLYAYGKAETTTEVSAVLENSAAAEAGLQAGDVILRLDGKEVHNFSDIQTIVALNTGTPVQIDISRAESALSLSATPQFAEREDMFGNTIRIPMLGISSTALRKAPLSLPQAFFQSFTETGTIITSTLKAIGQMVTGKRSLEEISGPIGIAKYSGQSMEQGWYTLLWFMAMLSINLGLVNLLPIPLLDGGHLLYYTAEALTGKPLAEKIQAFGYRIGFSLIASLAIFAIVNDVMKLL